MPTDEDDQEGLFFFNHSERGLIRCLGARSHCYCCLDPFPPLRGGGDSKKHPEMGGYFAAEARAAPVTVTAV